MLNPNKPEIPNEWLDPFTREELTALKDRLRDVGILQRLADEQRALRERYNEYWTYNVSSHIAWRALEFQYAGVLRPESLPVPPL